MKRNSPLARIRGAKIQAFKDTGVFPQKDFRSEVTDSGGYEMWLYDVIDSDEWFGITASNVVYALSEAGGSDVFVHVNSPGGMATEGLAIYNTFKNYEGRVTMRIEGLAASAASVVVLAGNEVVIEPSAMMMIHDAWGLTVGPEDDHRQQADVLGKLSDNIAGIYALKSGEPSAHWRSLMKAETWYVGNEAVEAGLVDSVNSETTEDAQNKWDRSIFAGAPQNRVAVAPAVNRKTEPAYDFAALRDSLKGVLA